MGDPATSEGTQDFVTYQQQVSDQQLAEWKAARPPNGYNTWDPLGGPAYDLNSDPRIAILVDDLQAARAELAEIRQTGVITGSRWRVGQNYGVHVYEESATTPEGDRPVATFFRSDDAAWVVSLVNQPVGSDLDEQVDAALATDHHQIVRVQSTIYDEIQAERQRAHLKHGETSMELAPVDEMYRSVILGEEIGEMAEVVWALALVAAGGRVDTVMNDGRHAGEVNLADLRRELLQAATMAAAWADRIPRTGSDHAG